MKFNIQFSFDHRDRLIQINYCMAGHSIGEVDDENIIACVNCYIDSNFVASSYMFVFLGSTYVDIVQEVLLCNQFPIKNFQNHVSFSSHTRSSINSNMHLISTHNKTLQKLYLAICIVNKYMNMTKCMYIQKQNMQNNYKNSI